MLFDRKISENEVLERNAIHGFVLGRRAHACSDTDPSTDTRPTETDLVRIVDADVVRPGIAKIPGEPVDRFGRVSEN